MAAETASESPPQMCGGDLLNLDCDETIPSSLCSPVEELGSHEEPILQMNTAASTTSPKLSSTRKRRREKNSTESEARTVFRQAQRMLRKGAPNLQEALCRSLSSAQPDLGEEYVAPPPMTPTPCPVDVAKNFLAKVNMQRAKKIEELVSHEKTVIDRRMKEQSAYHGTLKLTSYLSVEIDTNAFPFQEASDAPVVTIDENALSRNSSHSDPGGTEICATPASDSQSDDEFTPALIRKHEMLKLKRAALTRSGSGAEPQPHGGRQREATASSATTGSKTNPGIDVSLLRTVGNAAAVMSRKSSFFASVSPAEVSMLRRTNSFDQSQSSQTIVFSTETSQRAKPKQ